MGIIQRIVNIFKRGQYAMQQQSLGNITEHPRIAVSQEEYKRIMRNLRYYQSKWDDVEFMNTNGDMVKRPFNHLPIGRTAAKEDCKPRL